jgi:hypothetical protein
MFLKSLLVFKSDGQVKCWLYDDNIGRILSSL